AGGLMLSEMPNDDPQKVDGLAGHMTVGLLIGSLLVLRFVTRLMTFAAATCSRAQIHVFRTWAWTKGHFKILGPTLFGLVFVPIGIASALGSIAGLAFPSSLDDATTRALRSGLIMAFSVPPAWLGHALAANVYKALAREEDLENS
ncbi:MAG: hypothetical protein AAFR74_05765, partial [Pseudomonadota bacterium]